MPELPEVETIVRGLAGPLAGRAIERVEVLRPDLIDGEPADAFAAALPGRAIRSVTRRAKNTLMDLGGERLAVNLGMTGRLLLARPDEALPTHLGVRLHLSGGLELRYHDPRRFGRLWRMSDERWREWDAALGVEPLSPEFTVPRLWDGVKRSRVAIKTWLMDQRKVVGVGNIYASEALFRAGIDPRRPARRLRRYEVARLVDGVRTVLTEAIEHRGTTFLDYRDESGQPGAFARRLKVYDREGAPCTACGAPVRRIVQANRSSFFCDVCQH